MLDAASEPNLLPQFIKWQVWDLALDLIGYAEWIDPRRFPAEQVLKELEQSRTALDTAIQWTREVAASHPDCVCDEKQDFEPATSPEALESLMTGIRKGMYSHVAEQRFNERVAE